MSTYTGSEFKAQEMDDETGRRVADSGDSVHSVRSSNASPIHSKGGITRPPGLTGISLPSPVGKLGHSYTSSGSTAQNMTLTPTSSIDGGEVYARQSSPFHGDGPSMSSEYSRRGFDESELPPGITNLGSFDAEDGEHDGLLGLQALRERSHSLPGMVGPYSSSPPIRNQINGSLDDGRQSLRPRAISRDSGRSQSAATGSRPPLASVTGVSQHHADHKAFSSGYSSSGSRSRDHSPTPPGIISRPSNQHQDGPPERLYDVPRSRTASGDSYQYGERNHAGMDQLSHKFGQLNTSSHSNSRPNHPGFHRAQRSSSLPGPMRGHPGQSDQYPEDNIHIRRGSDYGIGISASTHTHDGEYHAQPYSHDPYGPPPGVNQRRSSLQAIPGVTPGFYGQAHNVHRRESLDFVPGHNRYPDGVPVVASNEEMRVYTAGEGAGYRHVSPAQSPLHSRYGHHSRHPSDMGNSALSSSPMSHSSGMGGIHGHGSYSFQGRGRHHSVNSEDDLSHPLIGEHIDVPADDHGYEPQIQHSRAARGGPIDPPLPHYGGAAAAHVMPSGGPAIQIPKIVYNVKFKRTQRTFALGPRLNRDLKMGTYVKVEADRGEDLGIVVGKVASEKFSSSRSSFRGEVGAMPPPPGGFSQSGGADLKRIIRLATHDEVSLLQMKREEENELLKICRTKVRQRGLPMNVVDAEYQFDRHKLTFFFEAEGRVDFRELVRDLFSMYKTRIWMQQLDKTSTAVPATVEEPQTVAMDYGTPIIAPESEYSDFARDSSNV